MHEKDLDEAVRSKDFQLKLLELFKETCSSGHLRCIRINHTFTEGKLTTSLTIGIEKPTEADMKNILPVKRILSILSSHQ